QILLRDVEGDILFYGGKRAAEQGYLPPRRKGLAEFTFDLICMIQHFIQRFVLFKQGSCGFLSHSRHTGDVVGRIPSQRLEVYETLRSEAVCGETVEIDDLHVAHSLFRPIDTGGGADQLETVAVAGEYDGLLRGVRRK